MNLSIWKCPLINKKSVAVSGSRENRSLRFKRSSALLVAAFFFCAAGTLAADAELLKNGGFDPAGASVENGGVPAAGGKNASWSIYLEKRFGGEIAVALDPAVGHLAPGAFRMIPGTRINASSTVHQSLPVVAGQTYELKGWVMGRNLAGASLKAGIQAEFRQADGKFIGKEVLTILDEKTPAGEWRSGTFRVKTPEGAGGLTFAAWGAFKSYPENAAAPEIYFDDFSLTGGAREEYGATLPADAGLGLWWCDNMRKIMRDQPVPKAATAEVTVEAARNEFEPFQICLRPKAELRGVRFETLGAPQGVTLEFFREEYVPVLKPMDYLGEKADYPDPLVPVEGALTLAAGQNHPFWIDLKVGGNTPAGTYEFKIKISRDSGEPVNIPVRLKVYPFSLPQSTTVRTKFGVDVWPKWHGDLNTEQLKTVWKKYLTALTSHRLSPFITFTYGAFPWKPKVLSADPATGVVTCDFSAFDEIMGFLFDENHSNSFSLQLQPTPELLAMGKERNWDAAQTAKVKLAYQRALVAHVKGKGWLEKCFLYAYDEPTPDHYAQLVTDLQRIKTEVPGLRRLVTFNNSMAPNGQFQNQVDIWVPALAKLDLWEAAQARRRGDQVWFYVCLGPLAPYPNLFIDHPSTSHRVLPWMVAQFNLDGFLYWNTTWSKFTNPWKEAMTRDEKPNEFVKINSYANGDGLLLYPPVKEPATAPVLAGPVPSIRLKMMREGLEDTEYLTLLRQRSKGEEALRLGSNLVHGTNAFELNPAHYQQVRRELAEAIVQAGDGQQSKIESKSQDAEAMK